MTRDLREFKLLQFVSAILVLVQRFCFRSLLSNLPCFLNERDSKMRRNRSVVTSQVDYVVSFGVGTVSSCFFFLVRRSERVLFSVFLNVVLSATCY